MSTNKVFGKVKLSKYNIVTKVDGKHAIFNTRTASVVMLNQEMYQRFFMEKKYDDAADQQYIKPLVDMGILVDKNQDENFYLETVRRRFKYSVTGVRSAVIAVTTKCNARCYYCYENGIQRENMSLETADAIVEFLAENCVNNQIVIQWFGGEPLCAVEVIDRITNGLHNKGVTVNSIITTNGYDLNDEIIKKAKEIWNVKRFQIPVDALEEQYNNIKNYTDVEANSSPFEQIINNIHRVLDEGFHVNVRTNFHPMNIEQTREVLSFLSKEFGDENHFFAYPAPLTGENIPSVVDIPTGEGIHPYLDLLLEAREKGFLCPTLLKEENYYDGDESLSGISLASRPVGCYATLFGSFAIDTKGELYKCHRLLGRGKEYTCGNVYNGIVYNDVLKSFCEDQLCYSECNECALMPLCHGGCKVKKDWYGGMNGCMAIKPIVEDIVKIYIKELQRR